METSVNLEKGGKVDLTKNNPGLKKLSIGLGWDVKQGSGAAFDLDAFALLLMAGKFTDPKNLIYFNNKVGVGILHHGDNLTGAGDGDDETISLELATLTSEEIILGVNIYQADTRKQNFGQVKNAFIRAYDAETKQELAKYDLSEDSSSATGFVLGRVYKHNGEWKFEAVGTAKNGNLAQIADTYK